MAVAYTGKRETLLTLASHERGIAQPLCRTGFLEIVCAIALHQFGTQNSDSCGRTAGCGSQTRDP
jgi:hypothetical protein